MKQNTKYTFPKPFNSFFSLSLSVLKMKRKLDTVNNILNVYCDGACSNNQSKDKSITKASFAVWFGDGDKRNHAAMLVKEDERTNNRAELMAIHHALKETREHQGTVVIHTDSKLAIDSLTKWVVNWERKGWKTAKGASACFSCGYIP